VYWDADVADIARALNTDVEKGLSEKEHEERLKRYGRNVLPKRRRTPAVEIFIRQFKDPLIFVLLVAAAVSAVVGETADLALICVVVVANGILGFIQEYKAESIMESLQKLSAPKAKVVRNGSIALVDAEDLVPGDIVIIEEGDVIPADGRIAECEGFRVNESLLTGESVPVEKTDKRIGKDVPLAERRNMVFAGTLAVSGRAKIIVTATGERTEMGKIAKKVLTTLERETHMDREIRAFSKYLTKLVVGISIIVFLLFAVRAHDVRGLAGALLLAASLAVAAVPEGLPAVVTIALSAGVKKMAERNALVRRIKSVETLGSVDVICTDKTGTLTMNKMRVVEYRGDVDKIVAVCFLCNTGGVKTDPLEAALLAFAKERGEPPTAERVKIIPFSSDRKMMSVVVRQGTDYYMYTKGAPERVFPLCKNVNPDIAKAAEEMAERGLRVIALAWKKCGPSSCDERDLLLAGVVGLLDPPREDVKKSVEKALRAGIRVIVVTGDHAKTAKKIAEMVGIPVEGIIEGRDIDKMTDEELADVLEHTTICARVSPHHKPRIVRALQSRGHIVAMTGDGVNDAVALKMADVGVAMGSGTDVAKEAADIILLDDSFSSIVAAIEEGRKIFRNIKKFVVYMLRANVGEVIAIAAAALAGWEILRPAQILWVNLLTDGPPATAMALDPPERGIMEKSPTRERILTDKDKQTIYYMGGLLAACILLLFAINAVNIQDARAVALTGFVVFEILFAIIVRNLPLWKNKLFLASIVGVLLLQIIALYTPLASLLSVRPLTPIEWLEVIGMCGLIYAATRIIV